MRIKLLSALVAAGCPFAAYATDGYFSHGYGQRAYGMGGASIAVTGDAFGGANNPATIAWAGDQFALGAYLFSPHRKAERTGGAALGIDGSADSDSNYFGVPELAVSYMWRPDLAFGITAYGNGGMNTNYPGGQLPSPGACGPATGPGTGFNPAPGPYNLFCGNGNLGVDLSQLIIAPTLAWRFVPDHAIGVAPLFAYQRFKAHGLQAFATPGLSTKPDAVTNNSYDNSTGWGARIGYYGQWTPQLGVGATWQSKLSMGDFDKYAGLFAQSGGFDIPMNWGVGISLRPTTEWLVAVDYERIYFSKVDSVGNPSSLIVQCAAGNQSNCLGGREGAGFHWKDVSVFRLGVEYTLNPKWTLRAGYNYSENPVRSSDVTFNILVPAVVQNHLTAGATYRIDPKNELTGAFVWAFKNSVEGSSLLNSFVPPQLNLQIQEKIQMYEWALGMQWAHRF